MPARKMGDSMKNLLLVIVIATGMMLIGCGGGSGDAKADKMGQVFVAVESARNQTNATVEWKVTLENQGEDSFADVRMSCTVKDDQGRVAKAPDGKDLAGVEIKLGALSKKGEKLTATVVAGIPAGAKTLLLEIGALGNYENGKLTRTFGYGEKYPFELN
jgi:hypothetical protein